MKHKRIIASIKKATQPNISKTWLSRAVRKAEYKSFLRGDYWRSVRQVILQRDNYCCQQCGSKDKLQVHHLTYKHHKEEHKYLEDLITLCQSCHSSIHGEPVQPQIQLSKEREEQQLLGVGIMKKLPRLPMRPDEEDPQDLEVWQPSWKCFCCADTGIITPHLAAMAIEGYDRDKDKLPRCVAPGCRADCAFDTEQLDNCIDYRVAASTCQELDVIARADWKTTVKSNQARAVEIKQLADKMKMPGCRDRTAEDDRQVQQRKQEVEAIDHEEWLAASTQYLGSE